jgi:hypothetical protein
MSELKSTLQQCDYGLSLTKLDLDDIGDEFFNSNFLTWTKSLGEEIKRIKSNFSNQRDLKFIDKLQTRLIIETYTEFSDQLLVTQLVLLENLSLDGNLLENDR